MTGDLAAGLLPDYMMEKPAPEFFNNMGILDAYRYMKDAAEDLQSIQKFERNGILYPAAKQNVFRHSGGTGS